MIAIVSDSSISLTKKDAEELGVHIVPMSYNVGNRVFHEQYSDMNGSFEKLISSYPCTTSQPVAAAYMSTFQELRRQGYEILCLVISSRLSGSYSSATLAAKEIGEEHIRVVDSRTVAGGMRFLVERARELIAAGTGLEETALRLEKERENITIMLSVENMEPLRKSGRLGFVRKSIGTILNIRPILMCANGALTSVGFAKGSRQQIEKLVEEIPETANKILIHCLGDEAAAKNLFVALTRKFPQIKPDISSIGPVLGIHIGIPAVGIAWMLP